MVSGELSRMHANPCVKILLHNEHFAVLILDASALDEKSHDKNYRLSLMVNIKTVLYVMGRSSPAFLI